MAERLKITYNATPTGVKFHASDAFMRGVMGPVRSGKSVMMSVELFRRACEQKPGKDNMRRTRFAVIRNTFPQLKDTTVKTFTDWFPESVFGQFNWNSMNYNLSFRDVRSEILFRALDRPADIVKLLSMELTGAWVNEARFIPEAIISALKDRVGQFPAKKDGGCSWFGVVMDTNPPDDSHWWFRMAETERVPGFFRQPGGLIERDGVFLPNPDAENIDNLNEGPLYYTSRAPGQPKDYVRVMYCGQYGFFAEGLPVQPDYSDALHCAHAPLEPVRGFPIIVGLDFGLTPAAAFMQRLHFGRIRVIDELVATNMGAKAFARELRAKITAKYKGFKFRIVGDPSGDNRAQTDETTPYQVLASEGVDASPVWTNDPTIRRESLGEPLRRMIDGRPAFELSPVCVTIRKGLAGAWCYRKKQIAGLSDQYHNEPDKGPHSHVCFASGTLVSTPFGPREIQDIQSGDFVSTPYGPREVLAVGSRIAAAVRLLLDNGQEIVSTEDHPFWTVYGFTEAIKLSDSSALAEESRLWKTLFRLHRFAVGRSGQYLNLMASGSIARRLWGTTKTAMAEAVDTLRPAWMMKTGFALYAAVAFALTAIATRGLVRLAARQNLPSVRVFNIEVEGAHCFYAGGVLVSNCEALEYACMDSGEGRRVIEQEDDGLPMQEVAVME